MAKNGISVVDQPKNPTKYKIDIVQETNLASTSVMQMNTFTANCRLSFQIVNRDSNETVFQHRGSHGPDAGFTEEQAKKRCLEAVAPAVGEKLVWELVRVVNERWMHGNDYLVTITGIPEDKVKEVVLLAGQAFRVERSVLDSYANGALNIRMAFKGQGAELIDSLTVAFDDVGTVLIPMEFTRNHFTFVLNDDQGW